jgi:hypothetical protein
MKSHRWLNLKLLDLKTASTKGAGGSKRSSKNPKIFITQALSSYW